MDQNFRYQWELQVDGLEDQIVTKFVNFLTKYCKSATVCENLTTDRESEYIVRISNQKKNIYINFKQEFLHKNVVLINPPKINKYNPLTWTIDIKV